MALTHLVTVVLLVTASAIHGYRLPTECVPQSYVVNLNVPSAVFTTENATAYTGTVSITFTTTSENVSEVVLHASAPHINVTTVNLSSGTTVVNVTEHSVNRTTDILTLLLGSSLVADQSYVLTLGFDGQLSNTDMYGFYKSSYRDSSNQVQYLVTTQMEATYARRAFPCFDEPSFKATFNISLTYPSGLNVLGNTPVLSSTVRADNTTTTVFSQTPVMSTYLVAFIVSSFTCSQGNPIEGSLPNQVCSTNESSSTRNMALEVAPLVIDSLNTYLNINYSANLGKLDQVGIPDFSAGAMENWGLVTYRERVILYDANETSNTNRQATASVIAHELAHQWFGNLVTCKWWSEIFLNEGFATFFEHFITHEIFPDMEMDKQFVTKTLQYIFQEDATGTEALRADASSPSEISGRFGSVSYDKGGSVLRMVEHILGTTQWKAGLNAYLNQFAHSAAEPDDLWTAITRNFTFPETFPAANLSTVMANWINYPGFPLITVTLTNNQLTFSQKRFVYNNRTDTNTTWYVPITLTTSQNTAAFELTTPMTWLTPSANVTQTLAGNIAWILLNNQQTGYFRVNYDSNLWAGITTALLQSNFSGIPDISRSQVVDDAFNLARGGYISYSQLFNITQFLSSETSYHVWYPAFSGFEYVLRRFGEDSLLGASLSSHILNISSSLIASVPLSTVDATNHIYTLTQVLAQTWACRLGHSTSISTAVRLFADYRTTLVRPPKNLRSIVYSYGLKHSTDISADWDFLWNQFLSSTLSTEQVTILAALGSTTNVTILNSYLQKTLVDNSGIRSQDYATVFSAVYRGSTVGVDVALDFFINNFDAIVLRYTSMNGVGNIIKGIAAEITTDAQILKLQNFVSNTVLTGAILDATNLALTSAQRNFEWVNTYRSSLYTYFGIEEPTTSATTASPTPPPCECGADKPFVALSLMILALYVLKF